MKTLVLLFIIASAAPCLCLAEKETVGEKRYFLIGNSLTWDTVPSSLDGDTKWHVDCGKSLPFIFQRPEKPCVKTSSLWPTALADRHYDVICLQVHYGSTLVQDAATITELIKLQPKARVMIHAGWARSTERAKEWSQEEASETSPMMHHAAYFRELLAVLRETHPDRTIGRTKSMEILQQVETDIAAGKAPLKEVAELYRDAIHMDLITGRYLMHNCMRHALDQPRSKAGFEKLKPVMKVYLDSVLDRVLKSSSA